MAVNKIYQDSIIAGGSIRDGQGKRIDTTYAKKSEVPDAYTLPIASTTTLGGIKVDGETINIDSNGKIFSKAVLLENSEDLDTLVTPDMTYYGTASSGCENLPVEGKSFNLQVLNAFNSRTDPAVVQKFTTKEGDIYVRAYYYDTNWTPSGGGVGGGGEQPMGPEWTAWGKLATTNDLVDKINYEQASIASIPSDKYEDLTLLASGQPYIAPENGYFYLSKAGSGGQYVVILNPSTGISLYSEKYSSASPRVLYRVKKGDEVIISYTATGVINYFRFYYDIGASSSV